MLQSQAEFLATNPKQAEKFLDSLDEDQAKALLYDWRHWARPNQLQPDSDWRIWLLLAGRGFGKTRSGAEWVLEQVASGRKRIALIAPTSDDARAVLVEGESGILARSPPWNYPLYEPSRRRIFWENGAMATLYSADEPKRLRGPQYDAAWADELATWRYQRDAWDNIMFGLRLGDDPRIVVTTTPKPTMLIREIVERADCTITSGSTYDNRSNLAPGFFDDIISKYEGTRVGRQEIYAELLSDIVGALWQRAWLDAARLNEVPVDLQRVVVAIDPPITSKEGSDECGIIVGGVGVDNQGYVLADLSQQATPNEWAGIAVRAYYQYDADRIVAEVNQGGDMVEAVIRHVDKSVAYRAVHATRGKVVRAEPIAALYEQHRISHIGTLATLEDQLCAFTTDFDRRTSGYSPDRLDALVWAFTDLMQKQKRKPTV